MSRCWLVMLATTLLLAGCSESPSSSEEKHDGGTSVLNRQGWYVWTDSADAPITFEREQTYGTNEGSGPALLGEITSLVVDSSGTVYVLDADSYRLVAFNPDGTVRWSAGQQGEGPGEFWRPKGMVLGNHGQLFVANDMGRQIDVWTRKGTFVERQTFEDKDLSFLRLVGSAEGLLVVSESGFGSEPQTIHAVDPETWDLAHSFPLNVELDLPESLSVSKDARTVGDSIFVSGLAEYTLSTYSVDGTPGRRISRSVDVLLEPGMYRGGVRFYSELDPPVRLPGGIYWSNWRGLAT